MIPLIDGENRDAAYIIGIYKTVWCPYTQEYVWGDIVMTGGSVPMRIIYRIIGGNPRSISTARRNVHIGISLIRFSR
jgi:hypothetical protein